MKTFKLNIPIIASLLILLVVMGSCKKKKTAPTLSLNGEAAITMCVGDQYVESGATATDAYGDDVEVIITSNLNENSTGTYTVEYSATDKNDNTSTAQTTVTVEMCASSVVGDYSVDPTCDIDLTVTTVGLVNDTQSILAGGNSSQIIFDNVNTFVSQLVANISGTSVTIPQESFSVAGVAEGTISAAGSIDETGSVIEMTYTYSFVDAFLGFELAAGTCSVTYTKQ
jgi:hypothetical protein